jgi:SAM-dependent methyltransferase
MTSATTIAGAYSATGVAWQRGPGLVYDRLADALVAQAPVDVSGRVVLDLGAGTGAASRALARAGAVPLALDAAPGMLLVERTRRPPAVVGDALALPFATGSLGGVVAAFSLNHVTDPARGLAECARVVAGGGPIVASAYAEDDTHPAKAAAEAALAEHGWEPPHWYLDMRRDAVPLLATVDRAQDVCQRAGVSAQVHHLRVAFPELDPAALVAWRLGMPHTAPFLDTLDAAQQREVAVRATALLGTQPPVLVRSFIVIAAVA